MAASLLASSASYCALKHTTPKPQKPVQSWFPHRYTYGLHLQMRWAVVKRTCAVVDDERWVAEEMEGGDVGVQELKNLRIKQTRPCQVYVCNLPRRFNIHDLLDMFQPFGTILSVEVSKNPETGVSRGCGYVLMSTIDAAKSAIQELDGIDVDGREVRVRFSAEMDAATVPYHSYAAPNRTMIYESPYKVYIGNLPWETIPGEMRDLFSQFGTVVSARVLHDNKGRKRRVYAFLSFQSVSERDAAVSLNLTEFRGRPILVRVAIENKKP